jgi:hypothetical protein
MRFADECVAAWRVITNSPIGTQKAAELNINLFTARAAWAKAFLLRADDVIQVSFTTLQKRACGRQLLALLGPACRTAGAAAIGATAENISHLDVIAAAAEQLFATRATDQGVVAEPPKSCAPGSAPLVSSSEILSSPPWPNTWISAVLATVAVPPSIGMVPLMRMRSAASRSGRRAHRAPNVMLRLSAHAAVCPQTRCSLRQRGEIIPSSTKSRSSPEILKNF